MLGISCILAFMEFVALDFETANGTHESACSLGLALMDGTGKLIDTWYQLIKPPSSFFDPANIEIHGITPENVADAPSFDKVWSAAREFIADRLVIAHNATFDMTILKAMLHWYKMEIPRIGYACTLRLSRKVWPEMNNYKLTTLSEVFGFDYRAHYALDDAVNCAKLFYKECGSSLSSRDALERFLERNGLPILDLDTGEPFAKVVVDDSDGELDLFG